MNGGELRDLVKLSLHELGSRMKENSLLSLTHVRIVVGAGTVEIGQGKTIVIQKVELRISLTKHVTDWARNARKKRRGFTGPGSISELLSQQMISDTGKNGDGI